MLWLTTKPVQGNNYDFSAPTHTIPNWLRFLPRFRCGGRVQPFDQIVNLSPGLEHTGYTYMPGDKINYGQRQREVRVGRRLEQKGDTLNDLPLVGPSKQHSLADHKYVRCQDDVDDDERRATVESSCSSGLWPGIKAEEVQE